MIAPSESNRVSTVKRHCASVIAAAAVVTIAVSCDLSVSNPGPVQDSYLDQETAHAALVAGMGRALAGALNYVSFTGAAISREIAPAGGQNTFGITARQQGGILDPGIDETNDHWKFAQQARWVAEDGVRRMRSALGDRFKSSPLAAQALAYVGFSNRLLGENMCVAIFDGGPALPRSEYFRRADTAFTEAIAVAGTANDATTLNAARAGRAAVRIWLNDWAGAASDARLVPSKFSFQEHYSAVELDQYNRIYWANANQPFRRHTVYGTFYENYYLTTKDPRTPWQKNPAILLGTLPVPWYFQTKFDKRESPIDLATGREMRLIVAEATLRGGDWVSALDMINTLRAETGVPPWTASTEAEAWTALKRERGIELWLEGRRLGDVDRWLTDKSPGQAEDMTGRSRCFPVGQTESDTNPNL